jgi:FtsH-binding integral membrane protein
VFLENTVYPHNTPLTKDLFFSGHVASVWIYFLCAQQRFLKTIFFAGTLLMSFMILSMRVHYTYDVIGALFFTSIIYFAPSYVKPYFSKVKAQFIYTK